MLPNGKVIFAPIGSDLWRQAGVSTKIKSFNYLCGKNDNVISFRPNIRSDLLGTTGVGNAQARYYNPHTKKLEMLPLNYETVTNKTVEAFTNFNKEINKDNPTIIDLQNGWDRDVAISIAEKRWSELAKMTQEASLELHGTSDTVDICGGDIINVNVILPNGKLHYSSGRWFVKSATHRITDSYTVTCDLFREFGKVGTKVTGKSDSTSFIKELESLVENVSETVSEVGTVIDQAWDSFMNSIIGGV
jgi:hypothetical protein